MVMIERFKYIFFLCSVSLFYEIHSCNISQKSMDCSGMNLTDCPPFNSSIWKLNLDNNFLKSLNTENCNKWTHLIMLSVENNLLEDVSNMADFTYLSTLNLKKNKITEIEFTQQPLIIIDISFNYINSFRNSIGLRSLETFNAGHNEIDNSSFKKFIKFLIKSPNLQTLVFDYNKISTLSSDFMSFTNIKMKYFGLSGNWFRTFDFGDISSNLRNGFTINLSDNNMTDLKINDNRLVAGLNLSNNLLTKIDGDKLEMFQGLKSIDLSNNPLNCLCNESASFIDWAYQHSKIFVNKDKMFCKYSLKNESIFTVRCPGTTTMTGTVTSAHQTSTITSPIISSSSSNITTLTTNPQNSSSKTTTSSGHHKKSLKITFSVIVLVMLGILIILIGIRTFVFVYVLLCRKRQQYKIFDDESDCDQRQRPGLYHHNLFCPVKAGKGYKNDDGDHQSI